MAKIPVKDLSKRELEDALVAGAGSQPYRACQIFRWLYKAAAGSFDEMKDIPASVRGALDSKFRISSHALLDLRRSLSDGTTKYLLRLDDGKTIETVLLPERGRNTICLSSQVGCKFACVFCASAPFGFMRDLSCSEILDEVLFIKNAVPGINVTNLVFMGIGEPLDNYSNVMKAIRVFNDKDAFNIGARKITISTCGVVPGIEKLAKEGMQIELSVSLHSANDAARSSLLPVNKKYGLKRLMEACRYYISATNRIITFEYVLLKGINSSKKDASDLAGLLKGIKCKVNVISYNRIPCSPYEEPSESEARIFMAALKAKGINATHRKPKGEDIDAGCGQLRISRLK